MVRSVPLGAIRADATKLRQAIFNLLSNAAKFTQNGQITLSGRRLELNEQNWVEITVADTGIGISPDQQTKLFSNFSQASSRITALYGGTGLGLSLSQNLCRLMGGQITVDSELGEGSRFTIRLPAGEVAARKPGAIAVGLVEEAPTSLAQERGRAMQPAKKLATGAAPYGATAVKPGARKVLIVDDDRDFLAIAERMFRKEGIEAVVTDAPQSALQIARTLRPAAIFLDILMPELNGWDVLTALKNDPGTSHVPVFLVSVVADRQRAHEAGAAGTLDKPMDPTAVRDALASIFDIRPDVQRAG